MALNRSDMIYFFLGFKMWSNIKGKHRGSAYLKTW